MFFSHKRAIKKRMQEIALETRLAEYEQQQTEQSAAPTKPASETPPQNVSYDELEARGITAETVESIAKLSNELRARHFNVVLDDGASYPATYVGEVLLFALRILGELNNHGRIFSELGRRWQSHDLPILQTVPIELSPARLIECVLVAVATDPLRKLELHPDDLDALEMLVDHETDQPAHFTTH